MTTTTGILLPLRATMSSSKTRYGGRNNSLSINVSGFSVAWLDANGDRWREGLSLLAGSSSDAGHSGNKHTMDPKYSWSGYNLDPEQSDRFMKAIFGTTVLDELNRKLAAKEWVLFKRKYVLPRERLNRFIGSKCRDRTWCEAVRLTETSASTVEYLRSIAVSTDDDDLFGEVCVLKPPSAPQRERMRWRCEGCGHEGHREAFSERSVPGLAGSTGLNCPNCEYRKTDALTGLLCGPTRGDVRRLPSSIMYPAG